MKRRVCISNTFDTTYFDPSKGDYPLQNYTSIHERNFIRFKIKNSVPTLCFQFLMIQFKNTITKYQIFMLTIVRIRDQ